MLYHILPPLAQDFALFNLFRYITFRTFGALLTALLLSLIMGPLFIRYLKKHQKRGQPIREDGPASHLKTKQGTPTMGGILVLASLTFSVLLWSDLTNPFVLILMVVTLGFGALGAWDDLLKLKKRNSRGVPPRMKFLGQIALSLAAILLVQRIFPQGVATHLNLPFLKNIFFDLGWFFAPFCLLVMIGASNAVNLTDGLDGLAMGPVMMVAFCFLVISYVVGHNVFATYLQITWIPGTGELAVFCGALLGAGLGFLWFNAPPAQVFMGDTGSLALGGALGLISVMTKHELVLMIAGGLFVIETLSVIMQVVYFKTTGKRFFLMAPIHHHYEKKGWAEQTVVMRFWIVSLVFCILGLATLKIR